MEELLKKDILGLQTQKFQNLFIKEIQAYVFKQE